MPLQKNKLSDLSFLHFCVNYRNNWPHRRAILDPCSKLIYLVFQSNYPDSFNCANLP